MSHLTRGAWIEISAGSTLKSDKLQSHLTRGAWIEILQQVAALKDFMRRTSHEVRGLKYFIKNFTRCDKLSHLTRGAWIEIQENLMRLPNQESRTSHEVRGLKYKIETYEYVLQRVAPHTRCVD